MSAIIGFILWRNFTKDIEYNIKKDIMKNNNYATNGKIDEYL